MWRRTRKCLSKSLTNSVILFPSWFSKDLYNFLFISCSITCNNNMYTICNVTPHSPLEILETDRMNSNTLEVVWPSMYTRSAHKRSPPLLRRSDVRYHHNRYFVTAYLQFNHERLKKGGCHILTYMCLVGPFV